MARFSLFLIILSLLFVRSDGQCSCSDLEFIKQLLQQEMFERKLEISKLRLEIQTSSNSQELIETDSFKGADNIYKQVYTLEQRVIELENASSNGPSAQDEKDFQSIVRNALKDEKIERVNLVANVQNQIERVHEKISLFMNTTDAFLEEQVNMLSKNYENFEDNSSKAFSEFRKSVEDLSKEHVTEMEGSMNLIRESMAELERNVSTNFEDFTITITKAMNDKILKTEAVKKEINDDVTNLTRSINQNFSANGSLEVFNKTVGTCDTYGEQWKVFGKKCYRFIYDQEIIWFDAKTVCENFTGRLLRIDSKEENDFVSKSLPGGGTYEYWIGINDMNTENVWQWSPGEENPNLVLYTNWQPGEPNDDRGNEDCGAFNHFGTWNDYPCSYELPYICEADLITVD